jgi:hypothetical protein
LAVPEKSIQPIIEMCLLDASVWNEPEN